MANTIAHLMVAQRILSKKPDFVQDRDSYYMGCIAPDTISSMDGWTRDDKKITHLRLGIPDLEWLQEHRMQCFTERVRDFAALHLDRSAVAAGQLDFNIGYMVHLLTDKWNHKTVRQTEIKEANKIGIQDGEPAFYRLILNDLDALDNYLLDSYPHIRRLFEELMEKPVLYDIPELIKKEYIEKSKLWWQNTYLPMIKEEKLRCLTPQVIEDFIELAATEIIKEFDSFPV